MTTDSLTNINGLNADYLVFLNFRLTLCKSEARSINEVINPPARIVENSNNFKTPTQNLTHSPITKPLGCPVVMHRASRQVRTRRLNRVFLVAESDKFERTLTIDLL